MEVEKIAIQSIKSEEMGHVANKVSVIRSFILRRAKTDKKCI